MSAHTCWTSAHRPYDSPLTPSRLREGTRKRSDARGMRPPATGVRTLPLCFASRGFWLPAATRIAGPGGRGLERLCRYVARPALAGGRLRILDAQRLCFALKTPWSDGTRHLLLSSDGTAGEAGGSGSPAPVSSPALPRGPGARARARDRIVPAQPGAEPAAADGDASCGGRPCWRGCFPPTSANARHAAVA